MNNKYKIILILRETDKDQVFTFFFFQLIKRIFCKYWQILFFSFTLDSLIFFLRKNRYQVTQLFNFNKKIYSFEFWTCNPPYKIYYILYSDYLKTGSTLPYIKHAFCNISHSKSILYKRQMCFPNICKWFYGLELSFLLRNSFCNFKWSLLKMTTSKVLFGCFKLLFIDTSYDFWTCKTFVFHNNSFLIELFVHAWSIIWHFICSLLRKSSMQCWDIFFIKEMVLLHHD